MHHDASHVLDVLTTRGLLPDDHACVFIVGSRARGWNNPRSDWDLYVVTHGQWDTETSHDVPIPLNPAHVAIESFYQDQTRWEVTYWRDAQVNQMLAKVTWEEFRRDLLSGEVLTFREELLLSRLADGVAVSGDAWLADALEMLGRTAFRSFLLSRSLGRADDAIEDALGQIESGDLESATLSARSALRHATDALLESHGEYGTVTTKWRPQRFRAASPSILTFDRYWTLDTMRTFDPDDPSAWIEEVLTVCQDVAMRVEVS